MSSVPVESWWNDPEWAEQGRLDGHGSKCETHSTSCYVPHLVGSFNITHVKLKFSFFLKMGKILEWKGITPRVLPGTRWCCV